MCTVSPFITALFSVKDWLVNIFNLALHTRATTFKRVDCKEKLTLNKVFYRPESPIKSSFEKY